MRTHKVGKMKCSRVRVCQVGGGVRPDRYKKNKDSKSKATNTSVPPH